MRLPTEDRNRRIINNPSIFTYHFRNRRQTGRFALANSRPIFIRNISTNQNLRFVVSSVSQRTRMISYQHPPVTTEPPYTRPSTVHRYSRSYSVLFCIARRQRIRLQLFAVCRQYLRLQPIHYVPLYRSPVQLLEPEIYLYNDTEF